MNEVDRNIMLGMISILNEASDKYHSGNPIMSDEQYDVRLKDLKQLEEETGFLFTNSPTLNTLTKLDYNDSSKLKPLSFILDDVKIVNDVKEIIKFADKKKMVASINLDSPTVLLTYYNGEFESAMLKNNRHTCFDVTEHIEQCLNVPYKINKDGVFHVIGKVIDTCNNNSSVFSTLMNQNVYLTRNRKLKFLATESDRDIGVSVYDNLNQTKELGFDVIPFWFVNNNALHPKNLQGSIDFVLDYAVEEGLSCDGVVFEINDENNKIIFQPLK